MEFGVQNGANLSSMERFFHALITDVFFFVCVFLNFSPPILVFWTSLQYRWTDPSGALRLRPDAPQIVTRM